MGTCMYNVLQVGMYKVLQVGIYKVRQVGMYKVLQVGMYKVLQVQGSISGYIYISFALELYSYWLCVTIHTHFNLT